MTGRQLEARDQLDRPLGHARSVTNRRTACVLVWRFIYSWGLRWQVVATTRREVGEAARRRAAPELPPEALLAAAPAGPSAGALPERELQPEPERRHHSPRRF